jgi:hypothetical protein
MDPFRFPSVYTKLYTGRFPAFFPAGLDSGVVMNISTPSITTTVLYDLLRREEEIRITETWLFSLNITPRLNYDFVPGCNKRIYQEVLA